jgi:hypothetical protein
LFSFPKFQKLYFVLKTNHFFNFYGFYVKPVESGFQICFSFLIPTPRCDNYNVCAFDVYIFEKSIKLCCLLLLFSWIQIFLALADGFLNIELCSSLGFKNFGLAFRSEVQIISYRSHTMFPWHILCQTK